ncbi:HU family DNA-binding protein [Bacteroides helcogenes]|uniref:DNA-binding protein n=1 Tax=Bacteroides helcogenes (strain ATCC 35417 / DSM 20613 / JCM 6297 / CCUG 15421 / P 36-108) TaxID=693979 RepID=E6SWY3_BACT6|nr:HU family DNA-binding protein [Bacteroides helcogenes]ADV44671.1 DNA-binding protein [Bacteroides helcogenes P 36-108]MDY5238565.1 HU family DNA-binding protein [Bacteroides helcogenes]
MAKFRFVKKSKPNAKNEPGKWYASPVVTNRLNTNTVCRAVTRNTTVAPTELESAFNLVCDGIPPQLQQGNSVQLGKLGTLRLSFGSAGVDDIEHFNTASMIKNVKVIFTPSKELMSAVKDGLSFENAGVVDAGFTYATTRAYKDAQAQGGSGTGGSGSGGSGSGDENENPLG